MNRIKIAHELSWVALVIVAAAGLGVEARFIMTGTAIFSVFYMLSLVGRAEDDALRIMLAVFEEEDNNENKESDRPVHLWDEGFEDAGEDNNDWMFRASGGAITSDEYYRSQFSAQEWDEMFNPQLDRHVIEWQNMEREADGSDDLPF